MAMVQERPRVLALSEERRRFQRVTIGKTQGRVVRHLEQGFAVEFMRLQHPDFLEESVSRD
jgi:hypothetical protein